jgi:hypothetical protein
MVAPTLPTLPPAPLDQVPTFDSLDFDFLRPDGADAPRDTGATSRGLFAVRFLILPSR